MPYSAVSLVMINAIFALSCLSREAHAEGGSEPSTEPRLTVSSLLQRFASMPGLEARFREEKHIELLEAPLVSEGRLFFIPSVGDDQEEGVRLLRRTTRPMNTLALIQGGRLAFFDGRRTQELDLRGNPVLRSFVESFSYLLAGDEMALRRLYAVQLELDPRASQRWELILTPRPEAMRRLLREVRLRGEGLILEEMRIRETSGDETVTTFSEVNTSRRFPEHEQRRLFRLPGQ